MNVELGSKRLEMLHELVPRTGIIVVLVNPNNPNANSDTKIVETAASALGHQIQILHASAEHEFTPVFTRMVQMRAGGLLIGNDTFFNSQSEQLATLSRRYAIPAIYQSRAFAAAGGLLSYGSSFRELHHQVGIYAGRILKGEKPADLPVQQSAKVELMINLKTAKALGLTVPTALLVRADEIIE